MIRPYEARDFADVAWLNEIAYSKPCTENELRTKLESPSWVFEDSPLVIGCLITCPQDEKIYVWSVAVAPNWRRRGIGGLLLAEAEKEFPELWLHTEPFSNGQRLYSKRGYETVLTEPDYYGYGQPAILMRKICGPGSRNPENCCITESM